MKIPRHEFSRPLRVDRVPPGGSVETVSADLDERAKVATRLGLPDLISLTARLSVEPARGEGLHVRGELEAKAIQACVVSLDDFTSDIRVPIDRYYMPAAALAALDDNGEDEEVDPIEHGEIDLGELVTESLAINLDPYPRKSGVAFGSVSDTAPEDQSDLARPFGELARLRSGDSGF